MQPSLDIWMERLPLRRAFRISRGVKTHAEVVMAELRVGRLRGRGECVPYARYGETTESVIAQLAPLADLLRAGETPQALLAALAPGAARNALDCALWDLEARMNGGSVAERLGRAGPAPVTSAVTVSLDTPEAMAAAAAALAGAPLLKVKLGVEGAAARLAAVARAAPDARLIVDPNEGWTAAILAEMADEIARWPVMMLEQPLPAGDDEALRGLAYPAPICADEAVHTSADLEGAVGKYQAVNIKLDKAGGLTGALAMLARARELGFGVMAGCMVASSLAIAPALVFAGEADVCDLDGPWWLAQDRPGGCRFEAGVLHPPARGFWGEPG